MIVQSDMNALWNCRNPNQGNTLKILCVCSAGLLRSPTFASVLIERGYNARACGVESYALIPISTVLIEWADIIIFVDKNHKELIAEELLRDTKVLVVPIPDRYRYRDPELVELINNYVDGATFYE